MVDINSTFAGKKMQSFESFITERFINLIGDDEKKRQYAAEVWDLLQNSYKAIGGIKGSGFKSKEDMIENIPFWKLATKNGKVVVVVMYKDKGGRKSVAFGTDGSPESAPIVKDVVKSDLSRSFGEKSKAMLGKALKEIPWDILKTFALTPEEAQRTLKKEVVPVKGLTKKQIPEDGQVTLAKYPELIDYAYLRDIGGKPTFKVMFGTTGKSVR